MPLEGIKKYHFWDWCVKQSKLPDTEEQKKCVHNFGDSPLIKTSLELLIWQCCHCKKINVTSDDQLSDDY